MNDALPGWYGKLPTLGDFAQRRLAADWVAAWDGWLAAGLGALQRQGDAWLDAYLASPSWRFVLAPGTLPGEPGTQAWAGVLMPSVDRVGRYFPLTIAQALPQLPGRADDADALWRWLIRIDEAAIDALHDDWTVEQLEAELERIGTAPVMAPAPPSLGHGPFVALPAAGGVLPALAAWAGSDWWTGQQGRAFWASEADIGAPRLLRSHGLPGAELAANLFGPPP